MGGMCKTTAMHLSSPMCMAWGVGHPEVALPEMSFKFASFLLDSKLSLHVVMEKHYLHCVALLLS